MEELWQVEANIDDMNPQNMEYVLDRLFNLGVNDAWAMPIMMKKCRMAAMLCVLCPAAMIDAVMACIFKETTSIGARYFPVQRQICSRVIRFVEVSGAMVHVKICSHAGRLTNISAEYDDCRALADRTGQPIKEIQRKAVEEAYRRYECDFK